MQTDNVEQSNTEMGKPDLCVGWFVIRRSMGILPKYLIIVVVSFALIMTLDELLVRRFNVVRFFFGMRPRKKLKIED